MNKPTGMAAYIAVTAAYWAFMLSDGALRMLVLLHFHTLGFSPVQLAYLFVLYEIAGIITNLSAGWIAARFGLSSTLYAGLALQILALSRFCNCHQIGRFGPRSHTLCLRKAYQVSPKICPR